MAERKRNKEIHFYVTEEERKLIRRKMIESKTKTWELICAKWQSTVTSSTQIPLHLRNSMRKCTRLV